MLKKLKEKLQSFYYDHDIIIMAILTGISIGLLISYREIAKLIFILCK